ncbi:hypothetical protein [Flavobacterium kingsejongi]|uniref:Uncharacterized protein n=1 Tax=Flavobacterium kingsejongi TaxID=1678728 RepID=A0A2S1LQG7_9FLAO|nr:hypothetical protein [Flavobacterium kingsejongi]AWG25911.1 hypothetical protein FK004_12100 [Flavobacterium kingsejongi]
MTSFKKSDLKYENQYVWKRDSGDGPYIGKIDRDRLDRNEGYEVLYFANSNLSSTSTVRDLHKFEDLIRELPSREVMKENIIKYIRDNW